MTQKTPNRRQAIATATAGAAAAVTTFGFTRPAFAAADPDKVVTLMAGIDIGDGKRDEAIAILKELTGTVEAKEPGVLVYLAHTQKNDPNKIVFFEVYENEEVFKAHGQQPHLAKLGAAFAQGIFKPGSGITMLDRVAGYIR